MEITGQYSDESLRMIAGVPLGQSAPPSYDQAVAAVVQPVLVAQPGLQPGDGAGIASQKVIDLTTRRIRVERQRDRMAHLAVGAAFFAGLFLLVVLFANRHPDNFCPKTGRRIPMSDGAKQFDKWLGRVPKGLGLIAGSAATCGLLRHLEVKRLDARIQEQSS